MKTRFLSTLLAFSCVVAASSRSAETVALWLFDEPLGLYPSTPLESVMGLDAPLVLGPAGSVVLGKYGNALSTIPFPPTEIPAEGEETAALHKFPVPAGRTQEPMSWHNAGFTALMTGGENHIRKEVSFVSATRTGLNLGSGDWTVEFWFRKRADAGASGVVLEVGSGPRGENDIVTRLSVDLGAGAFVFENQPSGTHVRIASSRAALGDVGNWHHYTFVHDGSAKTLSHYVDGRQVGRAQTISPEALPEGDEDYMSVGRDGLRGRPLPGELDELRVSKGIVYAAEFSAPPSFAPPTPKVALKKGPPLLFAHDSPKKGVLTLGSRKHVFIDDALFEESEHITFSAHPPKRIERVMENIHGQFRKHLTVIEDEHGLIRLYNPGPDDYPMVHISTDGLHFFEPDTGIHHEGQNRRNIVIPEPAPMGRPIIDPNGPPEHRWKIVSGLEGRGVYLYTSPDGWEWTRHRRAVLSFRSGSQQSLFYDDQRQLYIGFHRTGFPLSAGGGTRREFVMTEVKDIYSPWPVPLLTTEEVKEIAKTRPLRTPQPWWLDNGPLTPGDFGVELPTVFAPDDVIDPPGSGVYVPKASKYPWAPDAYFAFPVMYFDYEEPRQPETRRILYEDKARGLGSGHVETQIAVSRDGVNWKRFPSPTYIQAGTYQGRSLHQIYIAEGMVRRGDEIWQYFYGQEDYHSPAKRKPEGNGVYRTVQRLDGFISADAPYEREATIVTRPFTFLGSRLDLNINTGGMGYALVGFEDDSGQPVPGFSVDDCVYINGNFVHHPVEWLGAGTDVSALEGRTVRLVIRMRGASLFSMKFTED